MPKTLEKETKAATFTSDWEAKDGNTSSTVIFKSETTAIGTEMARGEAQKEITNDINSTKLNFLKIPEIWSDKSFKEHSKDTKQLFKQESSRGLGFNKSNFTPENKPAPEMTKETT
ncbi:hypothetical protein G9A89_004647 [Geosiphon pyriformis]|nr:hypothetical protein G9A89_004647 [Geosiphon pyriformis]